MSFNHIKMGQIVIILLFLTSASAAEVIDRVNCQAKIYDIEVGDMSPFFYYDAENGVVGENLPRGGDEINFCSDACSSQTYDRGTIESDGGAPQGEKYMNWYFNPPATGSSSTIRDDISDKGLMPITIAEGDEIHMASYFRFDRENGMDIWHDQVCGQSIDKFMSIRGDGIRWNIGCGQWSGGFSANQDHYFTLTVGNPTHHLNPELEPYAPNRNGYSLQNPIQLEYEKWYSAVLSIGMSREHDGYVALAVDGVEIIHYDDIITMASGVCDIERMQMHGTIAQPAYDAPPHNRKLDVLLLTDDWQDIQDGGYIGTSRNVVYCDNCTDCTAKLQSANIGDTVRLTTNLSDCDDTCITFDQPGGVTFDGMGHTISGIGERGVQGILLPKYADDCTIQNVTITGFDDGMYLYEASYTLIQNVTAHDNEDCGIDLIYGTGNEIRDCQLPENGYYDFYFRPHPIDDCNMTLTNVTGTNGLPIGYYTENVTLSDLEYAVLILCGADGSTLTNITITGSDAHYSNGMRMYGTDNATLTDIQSSDNFCGLSIEGSSNNTIKNVTCEYNWHYNIYMSYGSGNLLENITVKNSHQAGIYLSHAYNNTLTKIIADHNPFGIKLDRSMCIVVNDSVITNNFVVGLSAAGSGSTENLIYNNYFDNIINAWDWGGNIWNVTATPGQNIIGGPEIGGNYWSDYNGTDAGGDGFGDTTYNLTTGTDYLPLIHIDEAICGDVDCNGYVSVNDVVETYLRVVDPEYPLANEWAADADGDGYISANDVVEIYQKAIDPEHILHCIQIT